MPRRKLFILLAVLVLNGAFLFVSNVPGAQAYHTTSTYEKLQNGTLTSIEWNNLFNDFVNTWLPVSLNGPVGIATPAPASGLKVNGPVNANNIFSVGNVGIGTTAPNHFLSVLGTGSFSDLIYGVTPGSNNTYALATVEYVNNNGGSGALPSGTTGQTLRHDGADWVANSLLFNNGTNLGIGTTNPTQILNIKKTGSDNYIKVDAGGQGANYSGLMLAEDGINWGWTLRHGAASDNLFISYQDNTPTFTDTVTFMRSGNVGIGITNPLKKLSVLGAGGNTDPLQIAKGTGTGGILFSFDAAGNYPSSIRTFESGSATGSYMVFNTNTGTSSSAEVLRLRSDAGSPNAIFSGNIGIGVTNPAARLHIGIDGSQVLVGGVGSGRSAVVGSKVSAPGSVGGMNGYASYFAYDTYYDEATASWLPIRNNLGNKWKMEMGYHTNDIRFSYSAAFAPIAWSDYLTIKNTGFVGIGTTAPSFMLTTAGTGSFGDLAYGTTPGQSNTFALTTVEYVNSKVGGTGGIGGGTSGQTLRHDGTGWVANSLLFNNGTNIGIGTVAPNAKLEVVDTSAGLKTTPLILTNNSITANTEVALRFAPSNSVTSRYNEISSINNGSNGLDMLFKTGIGAIPSEQMRITNTGNVGIGMTNPATKLQIYQPTRNTDALIIYTPVTNADSAQGYGAISFQEYADKTGNYSQIRSWSNLYAAWGSQLSFHVTNGGSPTLIEAMRINRLGNVGVGTSAPASKLEVADGDLKLSGTTSYSHGILMDRGAALTTSALQSSLFTEWNGLGNAEALTARAWAYKWQKVDGTNWMVLNNAGNIGIGTTAPSYKLATAGTGSFGDLAYGTTPGQSNTFALTTVEYVNSKVGGTGGIGSGTSGQTLRHDGTGWVANSLLFNNGTNIGIGTTNPNSKLELTGDIEIDSDADNQNYRRLILGAHRSSYSVDTPAIFTTSGGGSDMYAQYGNLVIAGRTNGANGDIFFATNNDGTAQLPRVVITKSGNVGIGTTAPGSKLQVETSVAGPIATFKNTSNNYGGLILRMDNSTQANSRNWGVFTDAGAFGNLSFAPSTSNTSTPVWSDAKITFNKDGNVGIGTTNPLYQLQLNGARSAVLGVTGSGIGQSYSQWQNSGAQLIFGIENSIGGAVQVGTLPYSSTFGTQNATALHFTTDNTVRMTIVPTTGNVGIGTTAPSYKLTTAGTGSFGDLAYGTTPGQSNTFALTTVEYVNSKVGGTGGIGAGTTGQTLRHDGTGWVANSLLFNNGTNVGIGTTGPANKLDIQNTAAANPGNVSLLNIQNNTAQAFMYTGQAAGITFRTAYNSGANLFTSGSIYLQAQNHGIDNGGLMVFQTANAGGTLTNAMAIDKAGNVGIGTTAPAYRLHSMVPASTATTSAIQGEISSGNKSNSVTYTGVKGLSSNPGQGWANAYQVGVWGEATESGRKGSLGPIGVRGTANYIEDYVSSSSPTGFIAGLSSDTSVSVTTDTTDLLNAYGVLVNGITMSNNPTISNWYGLYLGAPSGTGTITNRYGLYQADANGRNYFAGSVGIGTANPQGKLDIVTTDASVGSRVRGTSGTVRLYPYYDATYGATFEALTPAETGYVPLTFSGSKFIFNNGNIGIGTTAPSYKLTTAGTGSFGDLAYGTTPGQSNTFALTTVEYVNSKVGGTGGIGSGTSGQTLRHDGTGWVANSLLYNNGTNVGIGTAAPAGILHVKGGVAMTSGWNRNLVLESTFPTQTFNSNNTKWGGIGYDHTTTLGGMAFWVNASSGDISAVAPSVYIQNTGNVGIGTIAPGSKLMISDVNKTPNGYIANSNLSIITTDAAANNVGGSILLGGANGQGVSPFGFGQIKGAKEPGGTWGGYLSFFTTQNNSGMYERLRIDSNGNVGIGTTGPAAKLDVGLSPANGVLDMVFSRMSEGNTNATGTSLAVRSWSTQVSSFNGKMFSIENSFYGLLNNSIEFYRGGSTTGGYMAFTTDNGTEKMRILANGNIGIGTTAPSYKLTTAGTGSFGDLAYGTTPGQSNTFALTTVEYVNAKVGGTGGIGTGTSGQTLRHDGTGWVANSLLFNNGTNVGIGTTDPETNLHISVGGLSAEDKDALILSMDTSGLGDEVRIKFQNNAGTNYPLAYIGSAFQTAVADSYLSFAIRNSGSLIEKMRIDKDGNVGIGATSPTAKLEVRSSGEATHVIQATASDGSNLASFYEMTGGHGAILIKDNAGTTKTRLATDGSSNYLTSGSFGIGTTTPVAKLDITSPDGTSDISQLRIGSALNNYGSYTFRQRTTGAFANQYLALDVVNNAGTFLSTMAWSGPNVGIGTTAPSYKLTTAGTGFFGDLAYGTTPGQSNTFALTTVEYVNSKVGGTGGIGSGTTGQTLRHDGTGWVANSLLYNNGTNVGIGTVTPNTKLSISGGDDASGVGVLELVTAGGTNLRLGGNTTYSWIQSHSSKPLYINALGNNVILNSGGGNVGIGTTTPSQKLDVQGVIRATDTGSSNGAFMEGSNGLAYFGSLGNYPISFYNNSSEKVRISTNGNVGIGTTAPNGILEVEGGTQSPALNSGNNITDFQFRYSPSGTALTLDFGGSATSTPYNWLQSRNVTNYASVYNLILNPNGGNVGIGTTAPSYKLTTTGTGSFGDLAYGTTPGQSNTFALTTVEYVNAKVGGTGGIGAGTSGQTLRHDGTGWVANSLLYNNGTNVGIGTINPLVKLQIGGDTVGEPVIIGSLVPNMIIMGAQNNTVEDSLLRLIRPTNPGDLYPAATDFKMRTWNDMGCVNGCAPRTQLTIGLKDSADYDVSSVLDILTLRSNGNVGIGITNPAAMLSLGTTALNNTVKLAVYDGGVATDMYGFGVSSGSLDFYAQGPSSGGPKMVIKSGNVGIGTTNPKGTLSVAAQDDSTKSAVSIRQSNDDRFGFDLSLDQTVNGDLFLDRVNLDVKTNVMSFSRNTGNVGIGTTNPKTKFQSSGSSAASVPALGTAGGSMYLTNTDESYGLLSGVLGTGRGWLQVQRTDSSATAYDLLLQPNGGNVGIGTTAPGYKLATAGTGSFGDLAYGTTPGQSNTFALTTVEYVNAKVGGTGGIGAGISGQTLRHDGTGWVANSLLFNNGTNIGVGGTNPISKFDVAGNVNAYSFSVAPVSGEGLHVLSPAGAKFATLTTTVTGAIKIVLPQSWTNTMMRMKVDIYEYETNESFTVLLGGYNYGPGTTWVNTFAQIVGGKTSRDFTVRFGHDGTKNAIWIGEVGSTWSYPQVVVTDFYAGYSGYTLDNWDDGWDIVFDTDFTGDTMTATQSANLVSPWIASGNNVYNLNSGNVGIGTSTPGGKLGIYSTGGNHIQLTGATLDGGIWTSGNLLGIGSWNNVSRRMFIDMSTGNVGIGTTAPSYKLTTAGTGSFGDLAYGITPGQSNTYALTTVEYVNAKVGGTGGIGTGTSGQTLRHDGTGWVANSLLFNNGTNVGVGTVSPGAKLEIVAGPLGNNLNDVVEIQRLYSGNGNNNYLDVRNIRTAAGADWTFAGTRIQEKIDSTWMGYMQFNGSGNNYGISFGTGNTTTAPGNVPERMRITGNGNVGIGTMAPNGMLQVGNNLTATTLYLDNQSGYGSRESKAWITYSASDTNQSTMSGGAGLTIHNNDTTDGNWSTLAFSSFEGAGGNNITPAAIRARTTNRTIGGWANGDLAFFTSPHSGLFERMRIDSQGNVGIGTTAPSYKLATAGTGSFGDLAYGITPGQSNTYALTTVEYVNTKVGGGGIGAGTSGQTLRHDGTGWVANSLLFNDGTNVGIGTTAPTDKLEVIGGNVRIWDDGTLGDESTDWVNSTVYPYETFATSSTDIISAINTTTYGVAYNRVYTFIGEMYKVTFNMTLNSGTMPSFRTGSNNTFASYYTTATPVAGENTYYVYAPSSSYMYLGFRNESGIAANFAVSSFSIKKVSGGSLAVNGNISVNGKITGGGTSGIDIDGAGAVTIGDIYPISKLTIDGPIFAGSESSTGGETRLHQGSYFDPIAGTLAAVKISQAAGANFNSSAFTVGINGTAAVNRHTYGGYFNNVSTVSGTALNYGIYVVGSNNYFSGNVGIGITNPTAKLDVVGSLLNSSSVTHSILGGFGTSVVMTDNNGQLYAETASSLLGAYLPLAGGVMSGSIDMGNNNITNIYDLTIGHKLTVSTIDPLYNLNSVNYSTFVSSIVGGVKEEIVGKINISRRDNKTGEFVAAIDFNDIEEGSDLWVWHQVIDFRKESVDVSITPYGRSASVYYLIDGEKLIFRADKPVEISYRLVGKRFDWRDWPTRATDQSVIGRSVDKR